MINHKEQCQNCKFHFQSEIRDSDSSYSVCRIDPPAVVVLNNVIKSVWPFVRPDNWCGQYKRK